MDRRGLHLGAVTFNPVRRRPVSRPRSTKPGVFHPDNPTTPLFLPTLNYSAWQTERKASAPVVSVITHVVAITLVLFVLPLAGARVLPEIPQHFNYILAASTPLPPPPPPGGWA